MTPADLRAPSATIQPGAPLDLSGAGRILALVLAAYGFFLPFSSAGVSLLLAAQLLLAGVLARRVWATRPWREPVVLFGLALVGWILLVTLLRDGWSGVTRSVFAQYKELLLAPVLYALFRLSPRPLWFLWGLSAGALAYAAVQWSTLFSEAAYLALVFRRISASFVFVVLAFVLLQHARHSPRPWLWRGAAAFLGLTVLFAMDARTGHLLLLVLAGWTAWVQAPRRWRLLAVVLVPVLATVVALSSSSVQYRITQTVNSLTQPPTPPYESTVIRREFVKHGLLLSRDFFLTGAGYAHYAERHQEAVQRSYGQSPDPLLRAFAKADWAATANPHNEYVMQVVGGGVVSLALFLAWLAAPVVPRRPQVRSDTTAGVVLAFAIGCLFNSLLLDFVEGHFYTALLMWLLATQARAEPGP